MKRLMIKPLDGRPGHPVIDHIHLESFNQHTVPVLKRSRVKKVQRRSRSVECIKRPYR